MQILLVFRYSKAKREKEDCHQKDSYEQFPREGGLLCHKRPQGEAPRSPKHKD